MATVTLSEGVALVTGAAQGIGKGIALRLADRYNVAVNDIPSKREALNSVAKEIVAKGRRTAVVVGDVSNEQDVKDMVEKVVHDLGSLDVMVANAGIARLGDTVDFSTKDWDQVFSVNVRGTFLCYKYAAKQMISQGNGGRIIGASSMAGKRAWPMMGAYSASKFAIRGLTQSAAQELGKYGITVNAYAPGAINTTLVQDLGDSRGAALMESASTISVLGRLGTPEDIAGLVLFLASKDADFITGQSVQCDGGVYFD